MATGRKQAGLARLTEATAANPQALLEAIPFQVLETSEVERGGQRLMKVKGILHRANEKNGNNRIYPSPLLSREVNKLAERLKNDTDSVFAQADHPSDGISKISDTAAIWNSVEYTDADEVVGSATILPTSKGKDLAAIIRAGGKIGISARGFGSTRLGECAGQKGEVVQDDYKLVTYDFVIGQSTPRAVVTSFAEQAQALGNSEEQVDLKTISIEQLTAERPDLVQAIEATVKAQQEAHDKAVKEAVESRLKGMTFAELETLRPDLVEEAKAKLSPAAASAKKCQDGKKDADDAEQGAGDKSGIGEGAAPRLSPAADGAKKVQDGPKDDGDSEQGAGDAEGLGEAKGKCSKCGAPLQAEATEAATEEANEQAETEQKLRAYCEANNLVLVAKEEPADEVEDKLATVETMLHDTMQQLTEVKSTTAALQGKVEQAEALTYLIEKAEGEKFPAALIRDLKNAKTKAEVDERFEGAKAKLEKVLTEVQTPKGEGKAQPKEEIGSGGNGAAKPGELTEVQRRHRELAGLSVN